MRDFKANRERILAKIQQKTQEYWRDVEANTYRTLESEIPEFDEEVRLTEKEKAERREKWLGSMRRDQERHRVSDKK